MCLFSRNDEVRVLLTGRHQMTPNFALGCNNAVESVASLTNRLHALLQACGKNANPSTAELEQAFAAYEKDRKARATVAMTMTGDYTRRASFQTWFGWFLECWVAPLLGDRFIMTYIFGPWIRDAIKLDFVEEKQPKVAKLGWKYP
jgi:2-polyprenyl-6-methoxyphenol hydroxylase-like FAD-dependent oxidoreductase